MYHDVGQYYFTTTESFKKLKNFSPKRSGAVIITDDEVQDIDNEVDWKLAEMKYKLLQDKG